MQVKAADDRHGDVDALESLLARPDVDGRARGKIEEQRSVSRLRRARSSAPARPGQSAQSISAILTATWSKWPTRTVDAPRQALPQNQ